MNQTQPPQGQSPVQEYLSTLDFSEPPDVQVIEASCALANTRTPENNKWSNILKEPVLIKKGSQIRCASSFINMSGMDQEIIQFQPTGDTQDNTHTMLAQLYTCNDGSNGKTTSYDYIAHNTRNTNAFTITQVGEGVTNGATANCTSLNGIGTGMSVTIQSVTHFIVIDSAIRITNPGTGYTSGDPLVFAGGGADLVTHPTGFIIADDFGAVKRVIVTTGGNIASNAPGTPITVSVSTATGGQGCVLTFVTPLIGDGTGKMNTFTVNQGGQDYVVGEIVRCESTGAAFTRDPQFRINVVGLGGSVLNVTYFDQGYNYARVPVFRWAQTLDFDTKFVYGRNRGDRSFISSNGDQVSIVNEPPLLTYDANLSNAFNLGNKEDEFAPGVFHKNGQAQPFSVAKATISIAADSVGIDFVIRTIAGLSEIIIPNTTENYIGSDGQKLATLKQNPLNQFSLGQSFVICFSGKDNSQSISDETLYNNLQANIAGLFQGVYTVGMIQQIETPINIGGTNYPDGYMVLRIGTVGRFDGAQIAAVPNSNPIQYTNPQVGLPYLYQLAGTNNVTGTPNSVYTVAMTNFRREDGQGMGGAGATVNIQINGTGNGWGSFSSNNNGTGYRQGDILQFANPDGSPNGVQVYVLSVDGITGQTFSAAQGTSKSKADLFQLNNAGNNTALQINIVPQPLYMIGIGNINNRPASGTYNLNYNAVGVMKDADRNTGSHFINYPNFPPIFTQLGLRPSGSVPAPAGLQNTRVTSALYKPNGTRKGFLPYNNLIANFSAHSQGQYEVVSPNPPSLVDFNQTATRTFVAGTDLATSQFYIGAVDPMPANAFSFKILKTAWGGDPFTFPTNYLILKYTTTNPVGSQEEHCYIQNIQVDATHLTVNLKARNIQELQVPLISSDLNMGTEAYRGNLPAHHTIEAGVNVQLIYISDWVSFNARMHLRWADTSDVTQPATIGFTNNKNFYGNNDINKTQLINNTNDWEKIYNSEFLDPLVLNSYSKGGYYYLTQASAHLGIPDGEQQDTFGYDNGIGFSQGLNEFPVGQICAGQEVGNPTFFSAFTKAISDVEGIYEYEKYMRQKTFVMEQNFQTPSSIGATWTKQASELTGAIDQALGTEMAPKEQVGLLQNEFITPVYGSNSQIGNNGQYIKDLILYPNSGGLEPGHCVGISGYDSNASYLATDILNQLPVDVDTNSIYFVFFRTFFTMLRNYDPLASNANVPDRTPLKTLNTRASNIGNVNNNAATPPVTNQRTLDGTLMIDVGPGSQKDFKLYELGNPAPTAVDQPFTFPGQSQEYPIRYIEQDGTGVVNRAKVSNYIGANNITLAFQQDVSAFGFTFLHQPYVTPFTDNQGGEVSIRVFFGNRKLGLFNQDAYGGISIMNYCRPDYPLGTFTFEEINNNIPNGTFVNGVNPKSSVAPVGRRFLKKLGFTDNDLGIIKTGSGLFQIDNSLNKLGIQTTNNTSTITLDDGTNVAFASFDTEVYGTTFAKLDSSDSILTAIPPPETSPGLASHVSIVTPTHGRSNRIIQKFGDYIFYPYSIDASTDSFNAPAKVRYDNASSAFGTIGGLNLTSGTASRGMGTPNVLGSTTVVSQNTVPISLNPDCNIYLSYTIQADSDFITASTLPVKLNHGHMIILSSIIQSPNYHLNNQGRLPGISIVNKTFLQGDYILSMGQLTFYAQKDQYISQITTEIVNNDYTVPSSLGLQSTVIYEITNFNPKPAKPPSTIFQRQQVGYLLNQQLQESQAQAPGGSRIQNLLGDLDRLGLGVLEDPGNNNANVINQLGQYIRGFDLVNLSPADRQAFYATDVGQAFVQHAQSVMAMERNIGILDAAFQEQEEFLGGGQDPRDTPYQIILRELGQLPGLPPLMDTPLADAMVAENADPLGDYLDGGGSLPNEFYDPRTGNVLDIADPLSTISYDQYVRDYVSTGPQPIQRYIADIQAGYFGEPPRPPPAAVDIGVARGGTAGGAAESGIGTSVTGSVQPPPTTATADTGVGSDI